MDQSDYPFEEKGVRAKPAADELRAFGATAQGSGGTRTIPAQARKFHKIAGAEASVHPEPSDLPRWVRALVQRKVTADEIAETVAARTRRAPSKENQVLALGLANEIARMEGGPAALERHLTADLMDSVSGRKGRAR